MSRDSNHIISKTTRGLIYFSLYCRSFRFVPTHLKVKRPDGRPGIGPGLPGSKFGKKKDEEEKKSSMFTQQQEWNQLNFLFIVDFLGLFN